MGRGQLRPRPFFISQKTKIPLARIESPRYKPAGRITSPARPYMKNTCKTNRKGSKLNPYSWEFIKSNKGIPFGWFISEKTGLPVQLGPVGKPVGRAPSSPIGKPNW